MPVLDNIASMARSNRRHIVLSEGEDERVIEGGLGAARDGLADITYIGRSEKFVQLTRGRTVPSSVQLIDPGASPLTAEFAAEYETIRRHKGVTAKDAQAAMQEPLGFAAMMVRLGHADGTIGGAVATTADTVRAALTIIGKDEKSSIVSSFFLMILNNNDRRTVVFADCRLVVLPTTEELADIALASAKSFAALVGETPKVAMLAFSTQGSAQSDRLSRVVDAADIVQSVDPTLIIDGEMQFDAAFEPSISKAKSPDSPLQGDANVFIFPNLHAGNIGYKIAQWIGGATAIGPILQGLRRPANDLSRGCSADDVLHMIAVTAVQAAVIDANQ